MLPGHVHQHLHLLMGQDGAGGVAGVGHQNGTGAGGDLRFDAAAVGVEVSLLRGGGHRVDHGAAGAGHGVVVGVEGLRDEDLVAVVENAVHGDLEGLGAAVGDEDVLGGEVHIQRSIVVPDGLNEGGDAGRGCVLQHRQVKAADGIEERLGRLDIRLTDVQVIDVPALGLGGHRIGVEFTHGRQAAFLHFAGKLHGDSSFSDAAGQGFRSRPGYRKSRAEALLFGAKSMLLSSSVFCGTDSPFRPAYRPESPGSCRYPPPRRRWRPPPPPYGCRCGR